MNWYKKIVLAAGGFPVFSRRDFIKALERLGVICTKSKKGGHWDLVDPINNTTSTLAAHDMSAKDLSPGVVKATIKFLGISDNELISGKRKKKEVARPAPTTPVEAPPPSWQQSEWYKRQKDLGMTG